MMLAYFSPRAISFDFFLSGNRSRAPPMRLSLDSFVQRWDKVQLLKRRGAGTERDLGLISAFATHCGMTSKNAYHFSEPQFP